MTGASDKMPRSYFQNHEALESTYWWHVNRRKIALAWIANVGITRPRLLDLGCGTGGFILELAAQTGSPAAVGLDASPSALETASSRGIDARLADLSRPVKLDDAPFDVATVMDVLEHLPDDQPVLETARVNLKPGGYLVASVPAYAFLFSTWDKHLGHYRRYTRPQLVASVTRSGFRVVRSSYAFSYALLPAIARRLFGSRYSEDTSVFPKVPDAVNRILLGMGSMEAALLRRVSLPFGLSACVLAQRD